MHVHITLRILCENHKKNKKFKIMKKPKKNHTLRENDKMHKNYKM